MKSIIDYSQIEPPKRKENEKPDTEEDNNDKPETGGNGGIETLKSEGQHGWMEKLLKKVRIYHLDSDLHFQSPPQTGSLPVSGNLKYTLRNPKGLDRGKINWIPAVKLASDRLFRSFFFFHHRRGGLMGKGARRVGGALWASVFIGPNLRDI